MSVIVALQETSTVKDTDVLESQTSCCRVGAHYARIEIHKVTVVRRSPLCGTNAVSVMTGRTRNFLFEMSFVMGKALIIENAVSTMTFVAQFVRKTALLCKIRGFVAIGEQIRIVGAVRPLGA